MASRLDKTGGQGEEETAAGGGQKLQADVDRQRKRTHSGGASSKPKMKENIENVKSLDTESTRNSQDITEVQLLHKILIYYRGKNLVRSF